MDRRIMMAWLQGQAQKQELTTTKMQQRRLGIFEQTGVPDSEEPNLEKRIQRHFSPSGFSNWPKPWTQEDENRMNMHNAESERISKIPGAGTPAGGPDAYSIPAPMERPPDAGKEETWFDRALSLGQEFKSQRKSRGTPGPAGMFPVRGDLNEQLSAEEEKYAKEHKSMLANMIDQYGKEKGTRVFYASVRNAVKKKK